MSACVVFCLADVFILSDLRCNDFPSGRNDGGSHAATASLQIKGPLFIPLYKFYSFPVFV